MCEKLWIHFGWTVHGCSQHMGKSHDEHKINNFTLALTLQAFLQLLVCESLCIIVIIIIIMTSSLKNLPFIHLKKILSCFLCSMHRTVRWFVAFG